MIDLHLHLDGSLNPENILKMAEMAEVKLPVEDKESIQKLLMVEPDCTNLGEYLEKFDLPLELLQTVECIEYAVYELMKDMYRQGLCYVEIRFAPQLHTKKELTQDLAVQAAIKGLCKGKQEFGLMANLILCCMRGNSNMSANTQTVALAQKYLGKGVCAVDLAGNEAAYPTELFGEAFAVAREKKIPIIIHAGEAAGADSIREALKLGAVRIGHGIHAIEDTELMNILKDKNIYLEMCYSSNLQTKTVDKAEDYPIVNFMDNHLRVTINTDNVTVSNTTLKREYKLLQKQFSLEDEVLCKLALNSADAAFVSEEERVILKNRINNDFLLWLNKKENL